MSRITGPISASPAASIAVSTREKGETLHAIAVEPQVAPLDPRQPRLQIAGLAVGFEELNEPGEAQAEDGLVVPKGVVGIEPDGRQAQAAWALVTRRTEAGYFARRASGRTGRRTSSPPQLGQSPENR
jgi:hypothetical protein